MCAPQYLEITFSKTEDKTQFSNYTSDIASADTILPFGNSRLYHAPVTNAKLLTKGEDVKAAFKLCLNIKDIDYDYNAGDSIGIFPDNNENDVNKLIYLLGLENVADLPYTLSVLKGTKKKNAAIPKHIPTMGIIRHIFIHNLDLRSHPKKLFLQTLSQYASSQEEKEKLLLLCSQAGSDEYMKLLTQGKTLIELLEMFPSCKPPVVRLLEYLPSIKPRPYSISSSPLIHDELWITFSVVTCNNGQKGLCSGWLETIATQYLSSQKNSNEEETNVSRVELPKVPFYFRKPSQFHLPLKPTTPIVMVGCGTGIAPFFGFLQHRDLLLKTTDSITFGAAFLFFGCRYADRDFLYADEIEMFLNTGALKKLHTAFSREIAGKKIYVQHLLQKNGDELINILNKKGVLYVCGDAKNMAKDVRAAIVEILIKCASHSAESANCYVEELERNGRYIQDIWL